MIENTRPFVNCQMLTIDVSSNSSFSHNRKFKQAVCFELYFTMVLLDSNCA